MSRKALGSACVLIWACALASCSKQSVSGIVIDRSLIPLISPETTMMAGLDLEALKSSPLYAKYKDELNSLGLDQFKQEFGVDPRQDLAQLVYVSDGRKQYLLARGRFDGPELERKVKAKGSRQSSYRNLKLWGDAQNSLVLMKGSVAAIGSAEGVRSAIDTEEDGRGEVPEEIAGRLQSMPKGDQIWLVSRDGLPFASAATRTDIQSALSNIISFVKTATGSIHVDTGVHLQSAFGCVSNEGATRVHDGLRAAVAIGRLSTKDSEASLLKIYDAAKIDRNENTVHVDLQLTGDQINELVRHFGRR
jgi:hypothetical protein